MTDENASKVQMNFYGSVNNPVGNAEGDNKNASNSKVVQDPSKLRQKLLVRKVKEIWLDDFLKKLLKEQILLEFELVERKYSLPSESSNDDNSYLDSRTSLSRYIEEVDIFGEEGIGRTVLIQGEPGAGKTLTLLKLVQKIIQRKEDELSYLPVVLNLSSWAKKRQSISQWLIEELDNFYGISNQKIVRSWIINQNLFLFFDGLDEVKKNCQADCIRALQDFRRTNDVTPIVICCREKDYTQLSKGLSCNSIVTIQSLTLPQINQYLASRGNQLQALKTFIENNPDSDIRNLAATPLNLRVMSLAFQDFSLEDISGLLSRGLSQRHLWNIYIDQMFKRNRTKHREDKHPYTREQTVHYLIWIAKYMIDSSQSRFLIERLQPSILQNQNLYPDRSDSQIKKIKRRYRCQSALIFGLVLGLCGGPLGGLSGTLSGILFFCAFFGGIGMLVGLIITGGLDEIQTVETLQWSLQKSPSSRTMLTWSFVGSLAALMLGLFILLINRTKLPPGNMIFFLLVLGACFGPMIGFLISIASGFRGPVIKDTERPNQGIFKSAWNTVIFGLLSGLSGTVVGGLMGWLSNSGVLVNGLMGGLFIGLLGTLAVGGSALLRYLNLRLTLCHQGYTPWNYTRFLNYATDRILLQRLGGGYVIPGKLREHLAEMDFS